MQRNSFHAGRGLTRLGIGFLGMALPATMLAAQETRRVNLSGDRVAVYNLAGEVRVEPGRSGAVTVEIEPGGAAAADLRFDTGEVGGRQALRIVYPGDRIVYERLGRGSRTTMRVREDGTWGGGGRRGREITIAGSGGGLAAHADLVIRVPEGRSVALFLGVGAASVSDVTGDLLIDGSLTSVTTTGTRGSLTVDVGAGQVRVSDAEGDVSIDTGSGGVEVSEVRGRSLLVDTGSGSVVGTAIGVDDLNVDTGSGRIELRDVRAQTINLDTGSGSVSLDLRSPARSVLIDTGSGGVTLAVPESLSADVEIETGSGGITVDFPVSVTVIERDFFRGRIGGGGGRIRIDTGSGSVRVTRAANR